MPDGNDMVKIRGGITKITTEKAILFHTTIYPGGTVEVWWPKSKVELDDAQHLWAPRWLVEEKEAKINERIMLAKQFL